MHAKRSRSIASPFSEDDWTWPNCHLKVSLATESPLLESSRLDGEPSRALPSSLSSREVDTKLPLFQRRFGVRYDFNHRQRKVTLSGDDQGRVDETCDELRDAFAKMELSSLLISRNSSARGRCRYIYAVSEASDHAWQFVRTPQPVGDANTKRFSYELVQHHRNLLASPVQDADISTSTSSNSLTDLTNACVVSVAQLINARAPAANEIVGMKAVFGRKLFRTLGDVHPQTAYSQQDLQAKFCDRKLQSCWSNVCDTEKPSVQALVTDLRAVAQRLPVNEPSERVSVYLKRSNSNGESESVVAKFARAYTRNWELARCEVKAGNRFALDAVLSSGVGFRVRVFNRGEPGDELLDQVQRVVQVKEPKDACDVFATRVSLAKASAGATKNLDDWAIDWVSIRTELDVPFEGLAFKLIGLKDELQLEAELPSEGDETQRMTTGAVFEQILTKLQAVLSKY